MPLPSIGGGPFLPHKGGIVIRLALKGHANRPFYHVGVTYRKATPETHLYEQLGTYDPMPNKENQRLLSLNIERTRWWMGQGATFSRRAAVVLGEAGFLPVHPRTYMASWRYRYKVASEEEAKKAAELAGDTAAPGQPTLSSST